MLHHYLEHIKFQIFIGSFLQLLFGKYQADEQAWIDTIKSVGDKQAVRISTMDWLGQSQFMDQTIYWSSLSSAISEVTSSVMASCFFFTVFAVFACLKILPYKCNRMQSIIIPEILTMLFSTILSDMCQNMTLFSLVATATLHISSLDFSTSFL